MPVWQQKFLHVRHDPGQERALIHVDAIIDRLLRRGYRVGHAPHAGGLQIVISNGDSGAIDAGKKRFMHSTIGLILLLLAGVILEFINPIGFVNS